MITAAERAIEAFERATGLVVCVQERGASLGRHLAAERFGHQGPLCAAAKLHRSQACRDFDLAEVGAAMAGGEPARVKVCHAGLVEWIAALTSDGRMVALLFAGQRRESPTVKLPGALRQERLPGPAPRLPTVSLDDALWIAELLDQLTARLALLLDLSPQPTPAPTASSASRKRASGSREAAIRRFVHERHQRGDGLRDLARRLRLSEERARHVVRQLCGAPLRDLLNNARLATAAHLLRTTDLTVVDVARASGFADVSRFHRCFRALHGTTAAAWRRQGPIASAP